MNAMNEQTRAAVEESRHQTRPATARPWLAC